MNEYQCFYKHKKINVQANTSLDAQTQAAKQMGAKKQYQVDVYLVATNVDKEPKQVVHTPTF